MKTISTTDEKLVTKIIYTIILIGFFLYYAGYACGQALYYCNH